MRFLLYANEWDVEGIIANRPRARDGENLNPERTGLGIVRAMVNAYGECYAEPGPARRALPAAGALSGAHGRRLRRHRRRREADHRGRGRATTRGRSGTSTGAPTTARPPSNLKRALDRVLPRARAGGYAKFKEPLRLSSARQVRRAHDEARAAVPAVGRHVPPPMDGKRWYHRFSALTATAGGFDLERDVLTGHGPLGALYPTNTTHRQKEGDTMTFLYLCRPA